MVCQGKPAARYQPAPWKMQAYVPHHRPANGHALSLLIPNAQPAGAAQPSESSSSASMLDQSNSPPVCRTRRLLQAACDLSVKGAAS